MEKVGYYREELNSNDIPLYLIGRVNDKTIFAAITDDTIYEFATDIEIDNIRVSNISDYYKANPHDNFIFITLDNKIICGEPEEIGISVESYEFTDIEEGEVSQDELYGNYKTYLSMRD